MTAHLYFHYVEFKNFLPFGNTITRIDLGGNTISVIMGENLDAGGENSRNGVGKSTIVDAISYALFGRVIRGISTPKLVHKLARRGQSMQVVACFSKDGYDYLIDRTVDKLNVYKKKTGNPHDFRERIGGLYAYDISQSKPETNAKILEILGYDITLFEYLVVNSSETTPFLRLREDQKREVIESLFGFTILSNRAEQLKKDRLDTNKELAAAESALRATKEANERIHREIVELEQRSQQWQRTQKQKITALTNDIAILEAADAATDIEVIQALATLNAAKVQADSVLRQATTAKSTAERSVQQSMREYRRLQEKVEQIHSQISKIESGVCPTCAQAWVPDPSVISDLSEQEMATAFAAEQTEAQLSVENGEVEKAMDVLEREYPKVKEIADQIAQLHEHDLTYETVEEAAGAGAKLFALRDQLALAVAGTDPHQESIDGLKRRAVKAIDSSEVDQLKILIEHYNFLIELLTNKNSYVRKHIINRWLPKLNEKIALYLRRLELPHTIRFNSDMTVDIRLFNENWDYGNLSKGERLRLTIALNLAFQDVFELLNYRINVLMVDELIDSGICDHGAELTMHLLKRLCSEKDKRVFLITHREDIAVQGDELFMVKKENYQSRIERVS